MPFQELSHPDTQPTQTSLASEWWLLCAIRLPWVDSQRNLDENFERVLGIILGVCVKAEETYNGNIRYVNESLTKQRTTELFR